MGRMKLWHWICSFVLLTGCTTTKFPTEDSPPASFSLPKFTAGSRSLFRRQPVSFPLFDRPVKGQVLSAFGNLKDDISNKGIDIQAPEGASIKAALEGEVSFVSDELKGFGRIIILDHRDGFQTVYAHNSENLVRLGQQVVKGQVIGRVGSSGRAASSFLHFEVRHHHRPVNPLQYLTDKA